MRIWIASAVVVCSMLLFSTAPTFGDSAKEQSKATRKSSEAASQPTKSSEGAKARSGKGFDTPAPSDTDVKASTGTKRSPVGQPVTDYKPRAKKSLKTTAPPSPTK